MALEGINPLVAYGGVFVLLFLAGCGLPLPEDIPLTFSGILLGTTSVQAYFGGFANAVVFVALVSYSSILLGDVIAYKLGKRYGRSLVGVPPFKWALTRKRMAKLDHWFDKYGNWTVFFGRMVAGIRFVTFFMAGMVRMPLKTFLLFDSAAALITVPAWIVLGYMLGTHFQDIVEWMGRLNHATWIAVGVFLALLLVWKLRKRFIRRKEGLKG